MVSDCRPMLVYTDMKVITWELVSSWSDINRQNQLRMQHNRIPDYAYICSHNLPTRSR